VETLGPFFVGVRVAPLLTRAATAAFCTLKPQSDSLADRLATPLLTRISILAKSISSAPTLTELKFFPHTQVDLTSTLLAL